MEAVKNVPGIGGINIWAVCLVLSVLIPCISVVALAAVPFAGVFFIVKLFISKKKNKEEKKMKANKLFEGMDILN